MVAGESLQVSPNYSFKQSSLRGLGTNRFRSGGPT